MRYRRKRYYRRKRRPYGRRRHAYRRRTYRKMKAEVKHTEFTPSRSISDTWDSTSAAGSGYGMLNNINAGSGGHCRIGNEIFIRRFILKGAILGGQSGLATDDSYNQVRILLLIGPSTVNMASALITAGIGLYSPITSATCPFVYKKLYDRVTHLKSYGPTGGNGYMPAIKHYKISKRVMRRASYLWY